MKSSRSSLVGFISLLPLFACSSGATGSLNGTWDVTSVGGSDVAPSALEVSNGRVSGDIISKLEGQAIASPSAKGCSYGKNRFSVDISIEGDAMTATFTEVRTYVGGDACKTEFYSYTDRSSTFTVTGKRTRKDASTDTDLNGVWEIQAQEIKKPITATVKDLGAEVPLDDDKGSKGSISIANGKLSVVFPGNDVSFNAQQR